MLNSLFGFGLFSIFRGKRAADGINFIQISENLNSDQNCIQSVTRTELNYLIRCDKSLNNKNNKCQSNNTFDCFEEWKMDTVLVQKILTYLAYPAGFTGMLIILALFGRILYLESFSKKCFWLALIIFFMSSNFN